MARPTKLTDELLDKLEPIADAGLSLGAVCQQLDISDDTWRTWESLDASDPLVSRFLGLSARVRARANVGMQDKSTGKIHAALDDPDVPAVKKAELAIQYLRLVGPQKVELTGRDGGPLEVDAKAALLDLLNRNKPAE